MATGRSNEYTSVNGRPGLLFIEPKNPASKEPLIDKATRSMTTALRTAKRGIGWMGFHECACGAVSRSCDLIVEGRFTTNSLAVHYLAHHRDEVPADELADVLSLPALLTEPTAEELTGLRRR